MAVPLLFLGNSYCAVTAAAFSTSGLLISPSSTRTERSAKDGSNINWQISQGLYMSVPNSLDVLTSGLASIFCLPRGVTVSSPNAQKGNVRIAKLYDVENSKSCRAVRERITELDLVVEQVIPVAAGSQNAASMPGGKAPVLVVATISSDGESGEKIEDTRTIEGVLAILSFLDESFDYPSSNVPQESEEDSVAIVKEKLKLAGMYLASWMRLGRGKSVSPSVGNRPEQPLILYSYEGNQFCRLVREVLTELDIVYEMRSAGKDSPRRSELASITGGSSQCPYLIDPNTGASMSESADIVEYLYKNYASWTPPSELLEWASTNVMSLAKPVFKLLAPLQAGEKDDESNYKGMIRDAIREIEAEAVIAPIVVYTYELSPFSAETTSLLDRIGVEYKEISLGKEWLPGLIAEDGAIKRAALLEMTGQSSLPHIFIDGKPIGGLFSGSPGLLPMLKNGEFSNGSLDTTASGNIMDTTDVFQ
jgi:glutaredoxin